MAALASASYTDLAFEWSMLCQDCVNCWTDTGKFDLSFEQSDIEWFEIMPLCNTWKYQFILQFQFPSYSEGICEFSKNEFLSCRKNFCIEF